MGQASVYSLLNCLCLSLELFVGLFVSCCLFGPFELVYVIGPPGDDPGGGRDYEDPYYAYQAISPPSKCFTISSTRRLARPSRRT